MKTLDFAKEELQAIRDQGIYRRLRVLESEQAARATIDGREVINLSSNNYLGLATHPRLKRADVEATERFGAGSGAVRTIVGTMSLHLELEEKLARFKHVEATVVFQSGFTCNSGVIPVLVGEDDVIISDELNHASIIDGCRMTRAKTARFAHSDMDDLRRVLEETRGFRRRITPATSRAG
mgnify:CR=1 FL=1